MKGPWWQIVVVVAVLAVAGCVEEPPTDLPGEPDAGIGDDVGTDPVEEVGTGDGGTGDGGTGDGGTGDGGTGDGGTGDSGTGDGGTGDGGTGDGGTGDGGTGDEDTDECFDQWTGVHPGGNFWECDAMIDCDAIDASWDNGLAADEAEVVELVNAIRAEPQTCGQSERAAVGPLEHMPLMRCASRLHAWDQQYRGYYDHYCPDGYGPGYRMSKTGAGSSAAENIYMTMMGPQGTVQGWMNSPGHCNNIMNGSYSRIGVGRYGGHWVMKLIW